MKLCSEKDGCRVFAAYDDMQAPDSTRQKQPDLIVLDRMLPQIDGLDVCRVLQVESDVPIIMLTACTAETGKLVGLELGAISPSPLAPEK